MKKAILLGTVSLMVVNSVFAENICLQTFNKQTFQPETLRTERLIESNEKSSSADDAKVDQVVKLVEENASEAKIAEAIVELTNVDKNELAPITEKDRKESTKGGFFERFSKIKEKARSKSAQITEAIRIIKRLRSDVKAEMTRESLDEYIYAFYGFHHKFSDRHYYTRKWTGQSAITKIQPSDVEGITPESFAMAARIAMEIEAPTFDYSDQSGESFRYVVPKIARYMGQNKNQQDANGEQLSRRICVSSWCSEESRHAGFLSQVVKRLTGKVPDDGNPDQATIHASDEASAIAHLGTRQTYEWNATSVYFFMLGHSNGALRDSMKLILRDEVKHLALMSAAYKYMYGDRPWKRFSIILKNSIEALKYQSGNRSDGADIGSSKLAALNVGLAHLFTEIELRKYLKTLPAETLADIFDSPSDLPELPQVGITPERAAEIKTLQDKYRTGRLNFSWWPKSQASEMKAIQAFQEARSSNISRLIEAKLKNFKGTELLNPTEQTQYVQKLLQVARSSSDFMGSLKSSEVKILEKILYHRLRDYQIRNNRHEVEESQKAENMDSKGQD